MVAYNQPFSCHCAALWDSFVAALLRQLPHTLPSPPHECSRPHGFITNVWKKKMQRLSRIKTRKKSQRAGNQMEIKSQEGFQGICGSELKVRNQPALRVCVSVCVESEKDTGGIQSWPCHAESYFPLAVARQHHLDRERGGIKTERGLTLTRNAHASHPSICGAAATAAHCGRV